MTQMVRSIRKTASKFMRNFSAGQTNIAAAFQVEENAPRGASVGQVTVSDLDSRTLSFSLVSGSGAFAINESTARSPWPIRRSSISNPRPISISQ